MSKSEKFKKKRGKTKKKNDLPVLDSDADFLKAFSRETRSAPRAKGKKKQNSGRKKRAWINKHGLPFIEEYETQFLSDPPSNRVENQASESAGEEEDFARLLDESLKEKKVPRHIPKPMPLKRRLKRYPPPETDLDLHGFTAVGAELKARSFIATALHQGFFTLRIVVGRGLHSQEGPVLPQVVEDLLKKLKKEKIVLAYEWEGRKKNSGAVIVYLKQFSD